MSPQDVSSYRLSESESQRIFISKILPAEFDTPHCASPTSSLSSKPLLAVLTVGQTGAGKTRLSPVILSAFRSVRGVAPVHLIADTYKTYHPAYMQLVLDSPQLASPATGPDARKWLAMASEEVVRRKLDVLLESACRHPDDFVQLVRIFHEAGYRVAVVMLAVPAALSRLGVLLRFYERLPEGQSRDLPVRLTPTRVHDDSYAGLLDAAAFLDDTGMADQVLVVRRGNLVAYGAVEGQKKGLDNAGGIVDALERERKRPLTVAETEMALGDLQKLSVHEDAGEQVEKVKSLLQPLLGEGTGDDDTVSQHNWPELRPLTFVEMGERTVMSCTALSL